jgi:hypothetical protein
MLLLITMMKWGRFMKKALVFIVLALVYTASPSWGAQSQTEEEASREKIRYFLRELARLKEEDVAQKAATGEWQPREMTQNEAVQFKNLTPAQRDAIKLMINMCWTDGFLAATASAMGRTMSDKDVWGGGEKCADRLMSDIWK